MDYWLFYYTMVLSLLCIFGSTLFIAQMFENDVTRVIFVWLSSLCAVGIWMLSVIAIGYGISS